MGISGVQEITAAAGVYKEKYQVDFTLVVVTNHDRFTEGAEHTADTNQVQLVSRPALLQLLGEYPICLTELSL